MIQLSQLQKLLPVVLMVIIVTGFAVLLKQLMNRKEEQDEDMKQAMLRQGISVEEKGQPVFVPILYSIMVFFVVSALLVVIMDAYSKGSNLLKKRS